MKQAVRSYAQVLYDLHVPAEDIEKTKAVLLENPNLQTVLENPLVSIQVKKHLIDKVFPEKIRNFLKVACSRQRASLLSDIIKTYKEYADKENGVLRADLYYVTAPDQAQSEQIETFLQKRFHVQKVILQKKEDKSLIGGFLLQADGIEYDFSLRGRFLKLKQNLIRR